ncbi:MAG: T9SS type A sorting domain-containing protein [Bacteroidetes bacterium]|nr:T9SS type A sorting domain-containing protein [Bacteroidota bacterium]
MKACLDGGYILFGSPFSVNGDVTNNHGGCDYWLIKLDSNNKFQWQKCFGGSCNDEISELIVTADSGFLCIGSTCSRDGDVSVNYGYNDAWLIKVDKTGNLVWEKSFGGSIQDHGRGVVQTLDGGIIVGGGTTSEDGLVQCQHRGEFEKSDAWVIKLDSAGNIQWQNCYGGSLSDFIYKIQPLPDSTYLLLGVTNSYDGDVSGNHGDYDYWVIKIDRWGNILWQKCYGGSGYDAPVFMKTLSDGNFMIGGLTRSNDGDVTNNHSFSGYSDMWLIKISPEGELIWEQCFGGTMDEGLNDAIELPGGKLLLIGESFTCNNTGNVNCTHHGPGTFDMWVIMVYDSTLVGINKKPASTDILQVYPNPATDYVRFSSKTTNSHTDNQIYILNQLGQIIKGLTLPLGSNQVLWDTSKIPSGLYYYLCKTGKSVKTGKIVLLK